MTRKYPNRKRRPGRKRKWIDFEILAVKLNPEQAVLTCCDNSARAVSGSGVDNEQMCTHGCPTGTGINDAISS